MLLSLCNSRRLCADILDARCRLPTVEMVSLHFIFLPKREKGEYNKKMPLIARDARVSDDIPTKRPPAEGLTDDGLTHSPPRDLRNTIASSCLYSCNTTVAYTHGFMYLWRLYIVDSLSRYGAL
jgi:hypothetical protein